MRLCDEQHVDVTLFEEISPNPDNVTIDEGAALARTKGIEVIIGVGGGSAMDAAKAKRLSAGTGAPIWDLVCSSSDIRPTRHLAELVLVPTMAGTGSEASMITVVFNPRLREKRPLRAMAFFPTVSIIDPSLTLTVPPERIAEGAIDTFCHVLEPYVTTDMDSVISDGFMETIMRTVVQASRMALADSTDLDARVQLSWASTLALSGVMRLGGNSGFHSCHGFAQALNGYYRALGHGSTLAYMLPAWLRSMNECQPDRLLRVGRRVFDSDQAVTAVLAWTKALGKNRCLRDVGVEWGDIPAIAESAWNTQPMARRHPGATTIEFMRAMYEAVY
jgi:alcohol dehydrogenase YqhD (iron-dependent ADH family)